MNKGNRLTQVDGSGNWSLKGIPWTNLHEGMIITRKMHELLYGALCKLKDYEDTGLSPEQIGQMDELYSEMAKENAILKKVGGRCVEHKD